MQLHNPWTCEMGYCIYLAKEPSSSFCLVNWASFLCCWAQFTAVIWQQEGSCLTLGFCFCETFMWYIYVVLLRYPFQDTSCFGYLACVRMGRNTAKIYHVFSLPHPMLNTSIFKDSCLKEHWVVDRAKLV